MKEVPDSIPSIGSSSCSSSILIKGSFMTNNNTITFVWYDGTKTTGLEVEAEKNDDDVDDDNVDDNDDNDISDDDDDNVPYLMNNKDNNNNKKNKLETTE